MSALSDRMTDLGGRPTRGCTRPLATLAAGESQGRWADQYS